MFRPEEYVINKAFSQSDIKIFEDSPKQFYNEVLEGNRIEQARRQHFDVGDMTDIFLLQQHLIPNYGVIDADPSEGVLKMCMDIYQRAKFEGKPVKPDLKAYLDYVEPAAITTQFYYNPTKPKPWTWGVEAIKKKVIDEGEKYFNQYVDIAEHSKRIVTKTDWDTAEYLENKIWNAQQPEIALLASYLDPETKLPENIKVLKAYPQYGTFVGYPVKHLGDFFIQDEDAKTVQPFDLKTADSIKGFYRNYWSCGYIKQGGLTSAIVAANFPDYTFLPFTFLVVPKTSEEPELFEMSPDEMNAALYGGTFASGKRYRGIKQSLDDIQWHIDNNVWDHKRSYYEHGNKNILNSFKDINAELFFSDIL